MYTLNYNIKSEEVRINFAVLKDALRSARVLDALKEQGIVSKVFVCDADNRNSFYLIPPAYVPIED